MIVVFTLGCKVNKYESEFIIEKLNKMGYETSENYSGQTIILSILAQ